MPSRQFLIQQSVLNAALIYEGGCFARSHGVNTALRCYCSEDWTYCRDDFVKIVGICYRDLCAQYAEVA